MFNGWSHSGHGCHRGFHGLVYIFSFFLLRRLHHPQPPPAHSPSAGSGGERRWGQSARLHVGFTALAEGQADEQAQAQTGRGQGFRQGPGSEMLLLPLQPPLGARGPASGAGWGQEPSLKRGDGIARRRQDLEAWRSLLSGVRNARICWEAAERGQGSSEGRGCGLPATPGASVPPARAHPVQPLSSMESCSETQGTPGGGGASGPCQRLAEQG